MAVVYIGLGSNLGERRENIHQAIASLKAVDSIEIKKGSSLYETEPEGVEDQPHFLNCALEAETSLDSGDLLTVLKDVEKKMGRIRVRKWGPRVIDLDILLYEDLVMKETGLEIPHPLLHERLFVLAPLSEIAPAVVHPVLGKSILDLYRQKLFVDSSGASK